MFWKLIVLAFAVWGVALYFGVTLGGLLHLLPVGALAAIVVRVMSRDPDSEFGRWRAPRGRTDRR